MSAKDRIVKNTTYLTIASMMQKVVAFVYYKFISDALQVDLSHYTFALSYTSIVIIFMDFGLGQILIREGAKHESNLQFIVTKIVRLKAPLMVASVIASCIFIALIEPYFDKISFVDVQMVWFGSLIILLDTISFTLFAIFRATRRLEWEAMSVILYQSMIFAVGCTALYFHAPVIFFLAALVAGSIVQSTFLYIQLLRKTTIRFRFRLRKGDAEGVSDELRQFFTLKRILIAALPFAIAGLVSRVYSSADTFLLKATIGDTAVSIYSVAMKLVVALTVIPGAFATVFYPVISAAIQEKKSTVDTLLRESILYILLISFPMMVGIAIVGDNIITLAWSSFFKLAAPALQVLSLSLPFVFLNYPIGYVLNAANKQHLNTIHMAIALAVNLAVNITLIPTWSFMGSAVAFVLSSIVLVTLNVIQVARIVDIDWWAYTVLLLKLSGASLIMGFILYWVQGAYPFPIVVLIAVVVYAVLVLLFRIVEITEVQSSVARVLKRAKV